MMPGFKAYDVKCSSCGWEKMIPVQSLGEPFGMLDKIKLPSKCPECGGRVKVKENKMIRF